MEGETDDERVLALRQRQMRNFFLALFVSRGVPMMLMGDEYGHTKRGNNNAYCQVLMGTCLSVSAGESGCGV